MNPEQLPKVDNEEYKPNLDAQDEEVVSGGSNRLTYILVALVVALVVGYVALPKGNGTGISSVTPSFMLDDAAVVASASDTTASSSSSSTDSIAAAFDAAAPGSDPGSASTPGSTSTATSNSATAGSGSSFDEPTGATKTFDRPATSPRTTTRGSAATTPGEVAALSPVTASSESESESTPGSVSAPTTISTAAPAAPSATVVMSGHIADENGRPLIGATVLLKGSTKGTSTDASGNYSIEVPTSSDNTLVFGYAGYEDEIVRGTGSKFANVILTPRAKPSKKGKE
jgi:hypothetical protein